MNVELNILFQIFLKNYMVTKYCNFCDAVKYLFTNKYKNIIHIDYQDQYFELTGHSYIVPSHFSLTPLNDPQDRLTGLYIYIFILI